ncbi:3-oxoadipyl-CoA thiolase [Martelella alba]|uniref:3-oxoadipyl-CoA thiolase n=1 Tax=Martelella alba TaxID=2590451 RepID=A0ABY2SSK6_9HYPH|nr:3-oxoadipyl-CoA thiolase [Martelella alba]TKI07903.1 3-oxoadipyl-CoA thiolase [Martelella alba]
MSEAFICGGVRTPFGRLNGSLSGIRSDDLAAIPLRELLQRHPGLDPSAIDDVLLGCANQAGEDNRNVARMASLLAGLPTSVPGCTLNRLCGSSLDAVATAARAIKSGENELIIAGGVESMSRAPYVMGKAEEAFSRTMHIEDTTMGWRFINPQMRARYGVESMPQTAENLADKFAISREDQDAYALRSQQRTAAAWEAGFYTPQIIAVAPPAKKNQPLTLFTRDEHPRATTAEALARLKPVVHATGTVTAGNASGLNDGACAMLVAGERALSTHDIQPMARIIASAVSGVAPGLMGFGPVGAVNRVLALTGLRLQSMDVIELNEAFAAQVLSVTRALGLPDDAPWINPNGGAIALGHPLGASGARLVLNACHQLNKSGGRLALCTMCIGVGQGIALILERV